MIDRDPLKCCPCCGTTEHLAHAAYNPTIGGIWQFVYCAACGARGDGDPMDTMEDILADCNEVFRYDDTRPQDRAHTYLKEHRVCRGYDDTAMERAAQDMIERAYTVGRMESSEAVARETARIIAEGIAKELGMTPGEEQR